MTKNEVIAAIAAIYGERFTPYSLTQFEDKSLVISTALYYIQIPYSKIKEIESTDEFFVIRLTVGMYYIIDHSSFRATVGHYS